MRVTIRSHESINLLFLCIRSLQLFEDLRFELLHFHYLLCRATFLRIVHTIGLIKWFKLCIDQAYAFELKNSLLYEKKWAELVSNRLILSSGYTFVLYFYFIRLKYSLCCTFSFRTNRKRITSCVRYVRSLILVNGRMLSSDVALKTAKDKVNP